MRHAGPAAGHAPRVGRRRWRDSRARVDPPTAAPVYRMWRVGVSSTPLGSNPGKNVSTHLGQIVYDSWRWDRFALVVMPSDFSASRHQAHTIFIMPRREQVVCRLAAAITGLIPRAAHGRGNETDTLADGTTNSTFAPWRRILRVVHRIARDGQIVPSLAYRGGTTP